MLLLAGALGRLCVQGPLEQGWDGLPGLRWAPRGAHTRPTPWTDTLESTAGGCGTGSQQVLLLTDPMGAQGFAGCEKYPFGLKKEKGLGAVAVGSRKG